jgi:hypothetical protein
VRDDLGLARRLFEDGQEIAGQAHGNSRDSKGDGATSESGSGRKRQGLFPSPARVVGRG